MYSSDLARSILFEETYVSNFIKISEILRPLISLQQTDMASSTPLLIAIQNNYLYITYRMMMSPKARCKLKDNIDLSSTKVYKYSPKYEFK